MKPYKIVNDPIYGFISVPRGLFLDVLDHPWVQRLRRISQLGCSHLVYPGAMHTRFHHAMGAFHLMQNALNVLESKGTEITESEKEGARLAILLHDVGHGPYSHALEGHLVNLSHESISRVLIEKLDEEFDGRLSTALEIFKGQYHKPFLNQLVASQLDMDRMDYLSRDSFYTGVAEGVISYDRITLMLNTSQNQLVIEEKGIYSLEKFLTARKLMYWQVYLHKTAVAAEKMLLSWLKRLKYLITNGNQPPVCPHLAKLLNLDSDPKNPGPWLDEFLQMDDINILYSLKESSKWKGDFILRELAERFLNRRLFKIELSDEPTEKGRISQKINNTAEVFGLTQEEAQYFVISGEESNTAYRIHRDEILILKKDGAVVPYSEFPNQLYSSGKVIKHFLTYPQL